MPNEYINNAIFEETIAVYKVAEINQSSDPVAFEVAQAELARLFYLLADNIIRAFKFQLIDRDDALQEGVLVCFQKLHGFNPELGRAFNYLTTVILNTYRQLYRNSKNYNELKKKYHDHIANRTAEMFINGRAKIMFRKRPNKVDEI